MRCGRPLLVEHQPIRLVTVPDSFWSMEPSRRHPGSTMATETPISSSEPMSPSLTRCLEPKPPGRLPRLWTLSRLLPGPRRPTALPRPPAMRVARPVLQMERPMGQLRGVAPDSSSNRDLTSASPEGRLSNQDPRPAKREWTLVCPHRAMGHHVRSLMQQMTSSVNKVRALVRRLSGLADVRRVRAHSLAPQVPSSQSLAWGHR